MAKLGGPAPASTSSGAETGNQKPQDGDLPSSNDQSSPKGSSPAASSPGQNPFSQLGIKQANPDAPKINITSSAGSALTPQRRDRQSSSDARSSSRQGETLEQWEDRALCGVFRITLDVDHKQDSHGHPLHYLGGTREEILDSGESVRLKTGVLDQAILEAASNLEKKSTPLDYLLQCWKRVTRQFKAVKKHGEQDAKFQIIREARRLCMSYCIFAVTMPDMFGYARVHKIFVTAKAKVSTAKHS